MMFISVTNTGAVTGRNLQDPALAAVVGPARRSRGGSRRLQTLHQNRRLLLGERKHSHVDTHLFLTPTQIDPTVDVLYRLPR